MYVIQTKTHYLSVSAVEALKKGADPKEVLSNLTECMLIDNPDALKNAHGFHTYEEATKIAGEHGFFAKHSIDQVKKYVLDKAYHFPIEVGRICKELNITKPILQLDATDFHVLHLGIYSRFKYYEKALQGISHLHEKSI